MASMDSSRSRVTDENTELSGHRHRYSRDGEDTGVRRPHLSTLPALTCLAAEGRDRGPLCPLRSRARQWSLAHWGTVPEFGALSWAPWATPRAPLEAAWLEARVMDCWAGCPFPRTDWL